MERERERPTVTCARGVGGGTAGKHENAKVGAEGVGQNGLGSGGECDERRETVAGR